LNISATTAASKIRCYGKCWWCIPLLVSLCLAAGQVSARETRISAARTLLSDGVYRIGARVNFEFNETLHDALHNGVPLLIELRFEVLQERPWLWANVVASLSQRFELQYRALSRRYLVMNYSTGAQHSFSSMNDALGYIGNVYDLPLIDANLLEPDQTYMVRMRADLDVESLPTPVRVWAYLGSAWSLKGNWYQWPLQP
jgi:hypothetical protein